MDAKLVSRETVEEVFQEKHGDGSKEQRRWDRHVVRRTMKEKLDAEYIRITFSDDFLRLRVVSEKFKGIGLLKRFTLIQNAFSEVEWMSGVLARHTLIMDPLTPNEYADVKAKNGPVRFEW